MRARVLLFASWAEAFGASELELELPEGTSVRDLLSHLRTRLPAVELPRAFIALNQEYASPDAVVTSGDEIAVIPPVAGG